VSSGEVYLPMSANDERPTMSILVRTKMSMIEAAGSLRILVAEVNPAVPVTRVSTLKEVVMSSTATEVCLANLLLGLAVLAVSVGVVGVYSLISYTVSWRTREIGLRMALGASRTNITAWVLRESLLLAGLGSTAGFLGALSTIKVLRQFLFEISPADPLTYTVVAVTMGFLALLAAWAPARRAARTDPMQALHME
jgi:ABC-type antimicrobial peptide transport system permease subunit